MLCGLTLLCYYLHCVSNQVAAAQLQVGLSASIFCQTSRTCVYVLQEIHTQVSKHV